MGKRKTTPEQEAAFRAFRAESAERLARLREMVARGFAELSERRAQAERRESS